MCGCDNPSDLSRQVVLFGCGCAFHRTCLPLTFAGCTKCNQNEAAASDSTPSPAFRHRHGLGARRTSFQLSVRLAARRVTFLVCVVFARVTVCLLGSTCYACAFVCVCLLLNARVCPQMGSLLDPFETPKPDDAPTPVTIDDDVDSDASDTDLGDDKEFLRQLQRARERAKDTRPLVRNTQPLLPMPRCRQSLPLPGFALNKNTHPSCCLHQCSCSNASLVRARVCERGEQIELYDELGLGSSTANVQSMRLNVAVPPPPPDSDYIQVVRRKQPELRKLIVQRLV